jgi:hypothetical protein
MLPDSYLTVNASSIDRASPALWENAHSRVSSEDKLKVKPLSAGSLPLTADGIPKLLLRLGSLGVFSVSGGPDFMQFDRADSVPQL